MECDVYLYIEFKGQHINKSSGIKTVKIFSLYSKPNHCIDERQGYVR